MIADIVLTMTTLLSEIIRVLCLGTLPVLGLLGSAESKDTAHRRERDESGIPGG